MPRGAVAALAGSLIVAVGTASGAELVRLDLSATPSRGPEPTIVESACLLSLERGVRSVPLSVLATAGTEILDLEASLDGAPVAVTLDHSAHPQIRGLVSIPAGTRRDGEPASVRVRYRVLGAVREENDRFFLAIPVVVVGGKPSQARPDGFTASLELPAGLHLRESFPAGWAREETEGRYRIDLPVVPAFVTVEASEHGSLLTVPRLLDLGTVLLLAGLGALAFRRLRANAGAS